MSTALELSYLREDYAKKEIKRLENELELQKGEYTDLLREYLDYQEMMSSRMYKLLLNNKENVELIVPS